MESANKREREGASKWKWFGGKLVRRKLTSFDSWFNWWKVNKVFERLERITERERMSEWEWKKRTQGIDEKMRVKAASNSIRENRWKCQQVKIGLLFSKSLSRNISWSRVSIKIQFQRKNETYLHSVRFGSLLIRRTNFQFPSYFRVISELFPSYFGIFFKRIIFTFWFILTQVDHDSNLSLLFLFTYTYHMSTFISYSNYSGYHIIWVLSSPTQTTQDRMYTR